MIIYLVFLSDIFNNVKACTGKHFKMSPPLIIHYSLSPSSTELTCSVTSVTVTLEDVNDNTPQWILKEFIIGQSSHVTIM